MLFVAVVPLISLLLLLGVTVPALYYLKLATIGRRKAGRECWECRFDLASLGGLASLCPECGAPIVPPGTRPKTPRPTRVWLLACALVLLAPAALIASFILRNLVLVPARAQHHASAANHLSQYAAGSGTDADMRSAVQEFARVLSEGGDPPPTSAPAAVPMPGGDPAFDRQINTHTSTTLSQAAARLLDDATADPARRLAFLQALMDEYRSRPIRQATHVDDIILDLLAGQRMRRIGMTSSDVVWASPTPRLIDAEEASLIVGTFLEIQKDPARLWNPSWGAGIERAWARGLLKPADIDRYIRQSINPAVVVVPDVPPRAGDVIEILVSPRWKGGSGAPVRLHAKSVGPQWQDRLVGPITRAVDWYQNSGSFDREYRGLLLLPDTPGKHRVTLELTVETGPDVFNALKSRVNPFDRDGDAPTWHALPALAHTLTTTIDLDLEPARAAPAQFSDRGIAPADLRLRPALFAVPHSDGSADVAVVLSISSRSIDIAFDAILTQDGREVPLGWGLSRRFDPDRAISFRATAPALDTTKPVTLLFRSAPGLLARPAACPVFWSGSVERDNIKINVVKPAQLQTY